MQEHFSNKELAIIPIAAFTASGELEKLKTSLNKGLDVGLTVGQVKEVLVQMYAYTGFPRSLNALGTFMSVVNERKQQGISDPKGELSTPLTTNESSLSVGTKNQTQLVGQPVSGPLFDFAPEIDLYLKAHLFGDIFQRDVLTWKERELATIAALANMKGVNGQLQAHFGISLNNDITPALLKTFVGEIKQHCGEGVALNADQVLDVVLG
ncbi:carboxymuconolactone decarboxylase family protein [Vibrio parahaemolyticus]|uniref:carboxymuconolactone decarboxylase family protein n=1 Tax=Vibrio parahaemolyticus TaxID=670 RepID=UPI0038912FAC